MVQKTLAIIKPDGVMKGVTEAIITRYLDAGLKVSEQILLRFSIALAETFYLEHRDKFFFEGLVLSMTSGQSLVLILEGEDAVNVVRKLNGATNPAEAEPGTIRHDFRSAGGPFNTVHGSDSPESAIREIRIILGFINR